MWLIGAVMWFWAEVSVGPFTRQRDLPRRDQHRDRAGGDRIGEPDVVARLEHHVQAGCDAVEVVESGELGDEGRLRVVEQLGRETGLGDVPVLEHDHTPGEGDGFVIGVGHDQRRHAHLGDRGRELVGDPAAGAGIERRQRLVQKQQLWFLCQGSRQRDPLALATREPSWLGLREVGDPDPLEQRVDRNARAVGDIRAHAHVREERIVLEHKADVATVSRRAAVPVEPQLAVAFHAARWRG